ncbi:response regulator transcription factor [Candidatus Nesciobacter abundans]|uniref:Response regulator transcription factor n=1 Tax=Candidatus Nesciobacter abundans TaxID=2601668 RepID=A0A5C0UK15_9PROT|nr:response regulator transcription factor [Candidatus Nesciobacter abundans]QEK39194.1 response regulator transcription factor [Candidatus Nesciobacter abundans]
MKILIIEDDSSVASSIISFLQSHNMVCEHVDSAFEGLKYARIFEYDAIIMDVVMPDMSGYDLLNRLRKCKVSTPVAMVSFMKEVGDKLKGFNAGADDYITKPFDKDELLARVNAMVRRSNGQSSSLVDLGQLVLDTTKKMVFVNDQEIRLTNKEYLILELLAVRKDSILTKDVFLSHLYDSGCDEPTKKIIDVFICKLRSKISEFSKDYLDNIPTIKTVWGRGYKLSVEPAVKSSDESEKANKQVVV